MENLLKKSLWLGLMLLLGMFTSCDVFDGNKDDYETYIIPGGEHSSRNEVSLHSGKELRFLAIFDQTAQYSTANPSNQADINKLYGFSDCNSQHQMNSARFGWRWFNSKIEIFAYCYNNGARQFQYITSVEPDQEYEYKIAISGGQYVFTVNGTSTTMTRGCTDGGTKYRLYPYFGGDEAAPHSISIKIKDL